MSDSSSEIQMLLLKHIVDPKRGMTYNADQLVDAEGSAVAYFNMKSFLKSGGLNRDGTKWFSGRVPQEFLLFDSDVIIANTDVTPGSDIIGSAAHVPSEYIGRAAFSHHVTRLRVKNHAVSPRFLARALLLERVRSAMRAESRGTTVKMLDISGALTIEIGVLPLKEQLAVVNVLDTLDTAIHQTEAIIAKLKAVKQGLLHDLMTRGIDANGELRPPQAEAPQLYKPSPLGWIPKEWEIESVTKTCSDVVDCPHSTPYYQDQGVLVARTMYIKDGTFLETQASRVSERQYQERIARLEPQTGDVIFTREAPVGEAFVIPLGMRICLGQRVMLLRPKNGRLVAEYLLAQIYSGAVKDRIATLTSGTTNPHLNVSEVKDFEIPLPPFHEQQAIAERLREHESRLQAEMNEKNKLALLKSGLMDDLLTGRVRVTPLLEATT